MSSSSSSDCENCDCCHCYSLDNKYDPYSCYGTPIRSSKHVPFCSTMGHPLIYYAEVQRSLNRRQRCTDRCTDQPKKENINCFVKAFKWYTQERVPEQNNEVSTERSGFANWLDYKYCEYLRDSHPNTHQCYQLSTQPTATIEPCVVCPPPYEPCTTKRFARVRSPWRKRRRKSACKDSGDVLEKCNNQSCEFIMQPKDLTRAASECCYPTPTSGCIKSNATVISSNVGAIKCTGRSVSLTSIHRETSVQKRIDIIPCTVQEGSNTKQPKQPKQPKKETPSTTCECREQILQVPSKTRRMDVSCQYPEEKVIPVNVETQYESMNLVTTSNTDTCAVCNCMAFEGYTPMAVMVRSRKLRPEIKPKFVPSSQTYLPKKQRKVKTSTVSCQCPEENIVTVDTPSQYQTNLGCWCDATRRISAPSREIQETKQVFGPKPIRRQSFTTVNVSDVQCECKVKEVVAPVSKCSRSLAGVANDGVQTSDHSISLDRDAVMHYPLYMKIICADRLKN